jgi:hypothetical protein
MIAIPWTRSSSPDGLASRPRLVMMAIPVETGFAITVAVDGSQLRVHAQPVLRIVLNDLFRRHSQLKSIEGKDFPYLPLIHPRLILKVAYTRCQLPSSSPRSSVRASATLWLILDHVVYLQELCQTRLFAQYASTMVTMFVHTRL